MVTKNNSLFHNFPRQVRRKKGQVWVETVIYTLIGLTVIGILLAVATPKINEMKDRLRINEAIDSMNKINDEIISLAKVTQNTRKVEIKISKGNLIFDDPNDKMKWDLESSYKFSELGEVVSFGNNLDVLTNESGSDYLVSLEIGYPNYDFNVADSSQILELQSSPNLHQVLFTNEGIGDSGKTKINIREK